APGSPFRAGGIAMFRRRPVLTTVGLVLGGLLATACVLLGVVKREPGFYRNAPTPSEWDAREKSAKLVTRMQDLKNDVRSKPEWGDTFPAEDLNCFFVENMSRRDGLCSSLPEGLHSPRVSIDGDRLKLGFRYRQGFWQTVVWVDLKVW